MPGLIRRSDIDEVRARVNIADIVGDYVTLKGAGVGSLKGLCPFHDERSPSFHVRPGVGRYHCFGCGEDGDVFSFLQKMDHTTFSEAVERMASRIGYELHYEDGGQANSDHGNRARLLGANAAAADFFVAQLASPEAEVGRAFLGERGFDAAAAQRFGVGFAPKSYDALSKHLMGLGYTEAELLAAGLTGQGDRRSYDRFRGRLVWPIRDVTGQTLGFGARRLLDDDQGPKYLNTPETAVYHKSQVLYGLDLAKRDISRGRQVVVVEGYTDVMACHLAGVTTAVATCGTAFGVDHIKVIRRVLGDVDNADTYGLGEVVFTFDPDAAGQKAASRAFAEEQRFAAQTFVAVAPDGLDPCDLRLAKGDDAVRRLITSKLPMFEFMIRRILSGFDLETVEGRAAALHSAAPVVAGIRDAALNDGYVRQLSKWLGLDQPEVSRAVRSSRSRPSEPGKQRSPVAAEPQRSDAAVRLVDLPIDPATRLERDVLMAVLQHPDAVGIDLVRRATQVAFQNPHLAAVRDGVFVSLDSFGRMDWVDRVVGEVPTSLATLVKELVVAPIPLAANKDVSAYCTAVTIDLVERELLRLKTDLIRQSQRTDREAEPAKYRELQVQLVRVEAERRALLPD